MNYKHKILICVPIFLVICIVLMWQFPNVESEKGGTVWWYSVIPPLLAITLAVITTRLFLSLGVAVGAGLFFAWGQQGLSLNTFFSEVVWFARAVTVGNDGIDLFNIWVILFVLFMMSMISVVIASGGIASAISLLSRLAKGPRSTQFITAVMGTVIFIGDYSNAMLVGPTMRPITDRYKVSREKLAYIVDSTSAPIAGLAFVSTWIGYEVGLFNDVAKDIGLSSDGYSMFFDALPFRFYCILTIIFVLINTLSGRDYGIMRRAQARARDTGDVSAPDAKVMGNIAADIGTENGKSQILSAVIPLSLLFGLILGGLWIDGHRNEFLKALAPDEMEKESLFSLAMWQFVFSKPIYSLTAWRDALSNAENVKILASAAITAFFAAIICGRAFSKMSFPEIGKAVKGGLSGTLLPIGIILCAWGIKASCDKLLTGEFIASILSDVVSPLWFPALVFVVASLTSFATGTSWGTMAILIPTAIPVAFLLDNDTYGITTIICLGAVLDGAIFGDHCSPISDTTILSAIVSSCDPMHHVRTQMPYALTVAVIALMCGYLPAALGLPSWIGIVIGIGVIILLFLGLSRLRPD
ncbi:Na+/H+ antiporter NhaC family protein [Candidatus Poribacteria bacterium]|nr:Na+/H+ antiporter NhaC family protein [Candidatus Poribacteria bacterium]